MLVKLFFISMILSIGVFSNAFAEERCGYLETQTEMNACAHLKYQKADKQLNETYQKAIDIFNKYNDEEGLEEFKDIQRAWLNYRDLNCNNLSKIYEGGTIAPMIYASCMERLTNNRTNEIPNFFEEWDVEK